jgi:hypothetical protein
MPMMYRFSEVRESRIPLAASPIFQHLLDKPVPAIYGPTADATWIGADPTYTEDFAKRA